MTLSISEKAERLWKKHSAKLIPTVERLQAERADAAEAVAAMKARRLVADCSERDSINRDMPAAVAKLKELDFALAEAKRDQANKELAARAPELQPLDDRLQELVSDLAFQIDLLNMTYVAVRDAAVALGSRVRARRGHPLSAESVEHALRTYLLGRLAVRLPGAGDVPRDVALPFRGAFAKRYE